LYEKNNLKIFTFIWNNKFYRRFTKNQRRGGYKIVNRPFGLFHRNSYYLIWNERPPWDKHLSNGAQHKKNSNTRIVISMKNWVDLYIFQNRTTTSIFIQKCSLSFPQRRVKNRICLKRHLSCKKQLLNLQNHEWVHKDT